MPRTIIQADTLPAPPDCRLVRLSVNFSEPFGRAVPPWRISPPVLGLTGFFVA
jgi:hypothetical protein